MALPSAAVALVATAVLAWPLGRRLARRRGCSRAVATLFVLSAGLILALTLTPNGPGRYDLIPPHYLTQLRHPGLVWATLRAAPNDSEEYANIALYLPLGFFGRYLWRSAAGGALCGVALTVAVETCQYGIVGRAGSLTDIRNNSLGAALGAAAAGAAIWAARRSQPAVDDGHAAAGRPPPEDGKTAAGRPPPER